ncbi:MAG: hypothetical protein Q9170_005170 [Blastenia crenularia]
MADIKSLAQSSPGTPTSISTDRPQRLCSPYLSPSSLKTSPKNPKQTELTFSILHQKYNPSPPTPLTSTEKAQVASFRSLRTRIHDGPYYTILDEDARIGKKSARSAAASFDPFAGMPTYSQKYMRKRRRLPKLGARNYVLKYFPKELWPTLDPKNYKASPADGITKKPLQAAKKEKAGGEISGDEDEAGGAAEKDPDEEAVDEPIDDAFDEDDDDGGDYNAEQYFDDGGDDMGDDLDGGEGDGGDYY